MQIGNALKKIMTEGGSYDVTVSLTRGGYWLHECTDLCESRELKKGALVEVKHCEVTSDLGIAQWQQVCLILFCRYAFS